MRVIAFIIFSSVGVFIALNLPAIADVPGTATIRFSNVDSVCINTNKDQVDFWITSMKITKEETWFTETDGVGAKADVVLFSNDNGTRKFPLAQSVDSHSDDGKIVRAALSFPILSQYSFDPALKIVRLDVPLILIRKKGDSDMAKYSKAMIQFTQSASSAVPTNPYAKGVELASQIADSFFSALGGTASSDQYDPAFQISYTLGKRDAGCTPQDLHDNVQAKISDYSGGGVSNIIKTTDVDNYCFYKVGSDQDPDIGYVSKPTGGCASTAPNSPPILNNPQVIYAAWGVPPAETKAVIASLGLKLNENAQMTDYRYTPPKTMKRLEIPSLRRAAMICNLAHLSVTQCFTSPISHYLMQMSGTH